MQNIKRLAIVWISITAGLIAAVGVGHVSFRAAEAATFTVNSTNDVNDGTCNAAHCSLREAITAANGVFGSDTIVFSLGGGVPVITLNGGSELPAVVSQILIDGSSGGATRVRLDGIYASGDRTGLTFGSGGGGSVVDSLELVRFSNAGMRILAGANGVTVRGTYVGVGLGNNGFGIIISSDNNVIGGLGTSEQNVITSNDEGGIFITSSGASGNLIRNNYIGTDPTGTVGHGNGASGDGIRIDATSDANVIGSAGNGRNLISGHDSVGITIASDNNTIVNNYVGTDVNGTSSLPNNPGIRISGNSNQVGGDPATEGNVISGNDGHGVRVTGDENDVLGNLIGTQAVSSSALGNITAGIWVDANASGNVIGTEEAPNRIAYNGQSGVVIKGDYAKVAYNQIYANTGLGVDLGTAGVALNDAADADTGPNNLQNFPIISSVSSAGGNTTIGATLNTAPGFFVYDIHFYAVATCDASGYGEGETFIGEMAIFMNASGDVSFASTFPYTLPAGHTVTATATFRTAFGGATSEFSRCFTTTFDSDGDGDPDAADNCPAVVNPGQENADGNFIDNPPPLTQDDQTRAMSDVPGDACDENDDNDGFTDSSEAALPGPACPSATAALNQLSADTDGDAYLDSAECAIGTNPNSSASKPSQAQCATLAGVPAPTDTDGDKILDRIEVCGYNTSRTTSDSDADGRPDGCEVGSINTVPAVNSGDQLILAQAITADLFGPFIYNADLNKDGANNSGDQLLMAQLILGASC